MAKRMSRLTIDKCDKCALIGGDRKVGEDLCTAFEFPEYQWRNGECWGRCESIDEMVERLQAIISYNECHGMNTAGVAKLRRELKDWQETASEIGRVTAITTGRQKGTSKRTQEGRKEQ